MSDYYKTIKEYDELASLDESADYEVDYTFVGFDKRTGKFVLVTASGCSCWDGDAYVELFDDLESMRKSLVTTDRTYNPSLNGAKAVMDEAEEEFRRHCLNAFSG